MAPECCSSSHFRRNPIRPSTPTIVSSVSSQISPRLRMNAPDTAINRLLSRAPRMSGVCWALFGGWAVIVGGYCLVSLTAPEWQGADRVWRHLPVPRRSVRLRGADDECRRCPNGERVCSGCSWRLGAPPGWWASPYGLTSKSCCASRPPTLYR